MSSKSVRRAGHLLGTGEDAVHLGDLTLGAEVGTEALLGVLVRTLLGVGAATLEHLHDAALVGGEANGVANNGADNGVVAGLAALLGDGGLLGSDLGDHEALVETAGDAGRGLESLSLSHWPGDRKLREAQVRRETEKGGGKGRSRSGRGSRTRERTRHK